MTHRDSKNIMPRMSNGKKDVSDKIDVIKDDENITLTIPLKLIKSLSPFELQKRLMMCTSELFTGTVKKEKPILKNKKQNIKSYPHIAFFIEGKPHYTGGRYSIYQQAILLSRFTKVTVVTNMPQIFDGDFKKYYRENFSVIVDSTYCFNETENDFDLIVGVPMVSGLMAKEYADKFNLPLYQMIFETPNWIRKYREGIDSDEEFWTSYKEILPKADKIIVPSLESKKYLLKWIKYEPNDVDVIYPCINEVVAKTNLTSKMNNKQMKRVLFTSRMSAFKNPLSIIRKLGNKYEYHFIGKMWDLDKDHIKQLVDKNYVIHCHDKCNDDKKFKLISECDLMIHPSQFEGFGMPPMEAIYFDKPALVYDLPVLREIYGNSIIYADDEKDFVDKARKILNGSLKVNWDSEDVRNVRTNSSIKGCTSILLDVFNIPKITAGMIVYNGEDYMKYAIDSVKHLLFELIIVEGAVKGYSTKHISTDKTDVIVDDIVRKNSMFMDITTVVSNSFWEDKVEMQNQIAKRVTGDFYLKLDHDEVWNKSTLIKAMELFYSDEELTVIKMPFLHLWLSFNMIAKDAGGKWGTCHPRLWRWKIGFIHQRSFNYFNNRNDDYRKVASPFYKEITFSGNELDVIFHFGYVRLQDVLLNKLKYYKFRGIENFVTDTITTFGNTSKSTQPTQVVKSWADDFDKTKLPSLMKTHKYYNSIDIRKEK